MKLRTSQILSQLSEQECRKAEIRLAELQARKILLQEQQQRAVERIKQLHRQRDQALRTRNAASLLGVFDTSVREQQANISTIHKHLKEVELTRQALLEGWLQAHRTHAAYDMAHRKETRAARRRQEMRQQRQTDDMTASRLSATPA